jgi:hypothetical protein
MTMLPLRPAPTPLGHQLRRTLVKNTINDVSQKKAENIQNPNSPRALAVDLSTIKKPLFANQKNNKLHNWKSNLLDKGFSSPELALSSWFSLCQTVGQAVPLHQVLQLFTVFLVFWGVYSVK